VTAGAVGAPPSRERTPAGWSVQEVERGTVAKFDGGEVELQRAGSETTFTVNLHGRRFDGLWEPRETGSSLTLDTRRWADGAPIEEGDWDNVLDVLWLLRGDLGGVRTILEWLGRDRAYAARRWDRTGDDLLFQFDGEALDVLALDRTLRAPVTRARGSRRLVIDRATARWIEPNDEVILASEWARIADRLQAAEDSSFLFTHPRPRFRVLGLDAALD